MSDTSAQGDENSSARYLVQPGDSISAIARRFNISENDLVQANQLDNPNQLSSGVELTLPGYDWISGLLIAQDMPFGESLNSLSLKYRLSTKEFGRLNRISSPRQLFIGAPILLPTERGENLSAGRNIINTGSSLLELAIATNSNPWSIIEANQLVTSWNAIPGSVLYIPTEDQPGPGALPSPISGIKTGANGFIQGRATGIVVSVSGGIINLSASLMGNISSFFSQDNGVMGAIVGIPALANPGFYEFIIINEIAGDSTFVFSQTIKVRDGNYQFERVPVDLPEELIRSVELEQLAAIVSENTGEKLWQGLFQLPTPFGDINSSFGTRRSYNGSPYDYYHGGIDFGGGTGTPIYAPANGVVAYVGELEIRGYTTIINHGWGIYTGYFHQSEILVNKGDMIVPGEVIGIVGNTGNSSGAHLHWELWVGGIQVDPLEWLNTAFP